MTKLPFYRQINAKLPYALTEELEYVRQLCLKTVPMTIVMLGGGPGHFAIAMFEDNLTPHQFFVVDHSTVAHVEANFKQIQAATVPIYIVDDSATVGELWTVPVDFLLVDADHSYEGALRDIKAWWPHVKQEGLVFFHDYLERPGGFFGTAEWKPSGVAKAIEEIQDDSWLIMDYVGISVVYGKYKGPTVSENAFA